MSKSEVGLLLNLYRLVVEEAGLEVELATVAAGEMTRKDLEATALTVEDSLEPLLLWKKRSGASSNTLPHKLLPQ